MRYVLAAGFVALVALGGVALGDYLGTRSTVERIRKDERAELRRQEATLEAQLPDVTVTFASGGDSRAVPAERAWRRRRFWYGAAFVGLVVVTGLGAVVVGHAPPKP